MEAGLDGVAALRAVAEELTKGQELVKRNLSMMAQHVLHIKILIQEAVIQWAAVVEQQQVVMVGIKMVTAAKVVTEELKNGREHVIENHITQAQHVHHILIPKLLVVIREDVALVRENQVVEDGVDTVDVVEEVNIELDHASMYLQ